MAVTRLVDVIEPTVFLDYKSIYSPENNTLVQSGAVVRNPEFDARVAGPGSVIDMPFWNDLSDEEADTMTENPADIAVPGNITTGEQIARKQLLHKSWGEANLINELSGEDALEEIVGKKDKYWTKQFKRRVLASLAGVVADNVANDDGDMVIDISKKAAGALEAKNYFSGDAVIDAGMTMGDRFLDVEIMFCHTDIAARMLKNKDTVQIADANGMRMETYKGMRVVVDDDSVSTIDAFGNKVYKTYFLGRGAIAYGEALPSVPVEVSREAAQGNGGGVDVLHTRKHWILHPFGFQFTSLSLSAPRVGSTSTPITAKEVDLAKAVNWNRVVDRKLIPIAALVSN